MQKRGNEQGVAVGCVRCMQSRDRSISSTRPSKFAPQRKSSPEGPSGADLLACIHDLAQNLCATSLSELPVVLQWPSRFFLEAARRQGAARGPAAADASISSRLIFFWPHPLRIARAGTT